MSDLLIQEVKNGLRSVEDNLRGQITEKLAAQDAKLERALNDIGLNMSSFKGATMTAAPIDTIGAQVFQKFSENRDLFEKTRSIRLEVKATPDVVGIKAAGDPITTSSGRMLATAGVGSITGGVIGLQNALPTRAASGTSAVEYSRFTGVQGAAGVQAREGNAKAAVRPDHTLVVQSAITVAGFAKMSRQALSDSNELKAAINVTLARSVAQALDAAIVSGIAEPAFEGYGVLATAHTSTVYTQLVDAVSEGVANMQAAGFAPDAVAMNPASWLAITTARGTANDHYLSGSYLGVLPSEMRGLRVVLSPSIADGKALLMDTAHAELLVADAFSVEIAYSGDDFTKNLVTVLGEMRVIPVFRTVGSMRLITPKAA